MPYPPVVQFETRQREVEECLALMESVPRGEKTPSFLRRLRLRSARTADRSGAQAANRCADPVAPW